MPTTTAPTPDPRYRSRPDPARRLANDPPFAEQFEIMKRYGARPSTPACPTHSERRGSLPRLSPSK